MKRAVFAVCGVAFAAVICGCASQQIVQREFYEPNEATMREREDGLKVGALKSETVKTGQPDWSTKSISLISVGK